MAYTINANAKNVWIRDNEDTRDLSIQTDASSVYLDNGRTLEQELGEGSMVSNVATVDTSMSKIIDGTLDGAYESLIFKGRTLVNLANKSQENAHYTDYNLSYIDKTKTYFIKVISTKAIVKIGFIVNNTTWNNSVDCEQITNGYVIIKPNETLEVGGLRVITSDSTTSYTLKTMIIEYQEGMENWDIPYFEGICDVKMPILHNVGKNLFDPSKHHHLTSRGDCYSVDETSSGVNTVEYVLEPNSQYILSFNKYGTNSCWISVTINGAYTNNNNTNYSKAFTTNSTGKATIKIAANAIDDKGHTISNIMLRKATDGSAYEDHKTNILRTSEEIVLRKVNEACDTYNPLTGEYIKRIGEIMLDGSDDESWTIYTNGREKTIQFRFDMKSTAKGQSDYTKIISSHLPSVDIINNNDIEGVSIYSNGNIYISLLRTKAETLSSLKSYLQSNPITVQYELAEPITTIVEPSTIPFAYQNGHIILESGSEGQSLLPTLEYSTVVNRTGQVEGVAKVIQKQEKQLTMLEQMLIQNIIGLDYSNTVLALNLEINEVM